MIAVHLIVIREWVNRTPPIFREGRLMETLTGIALNNLTAELNKPYDTYKKVGSGVNKGGRYIDGDDARDRFNTVFGPMGAGWRIVPHPRNGTTSHYTEERKNKDGLVQTWYVVVCEGYQFEYAMRDDNNQIIWCSACPVGAVHENMNFNYAYRGVLTTLSTTSRDSWGASSKLCAPSFEKKPQ